MFVFPDQCFGRPNLAVVEAVILRQFNRRLKPELRFAVRVVHMDMEPGFREKRRRTETRPRGRLSGSRIILPATNGAELSVTPDERGLPCGLGRMVTT
jgi:hypothetical protein